MRILCSLVAALALHVAIAAAPERLVAITIDDLPRGGDGGARTMPAVREMTAKLMAPFREGRIPVTGFVNEGRAADLGPGGSARSSTSGSMLAPISATTPIHIRTSTMSR